MVNIEGYDNPFELRRMVPEQVAEAVAWLLPTWYVQNRSTRIECHPSGGFAGGYKPEDLATLAEALGRIGLNVTRIEDRSGE